MSCVLTCRPGKFDGAREKGTELPLPAQPAQAKKTNAADCVFHQGLQSVSLPGQARQGFFDAGPGWRAPGISIHLCCAKPSSAAALPPGP